MNLSFLLRHYQQVTVKHLRNTSFWFTTTEDKLSNLFLITHTHMAQILSCILLSGFIYKRTSKVFVAKYTMCFTFQNQLTIVISNKFNVPYNTFQTIFYKISWHLSTIIKLCYRFKSLHNIYILLSNTFTHANTDWFDYLNTPNTLIAHILNNNALV